jgi:hypothetical protein
MPDPSLQPRVGERGWKGEEGKRELDKEGEKKRER